MDDQNLYRSKFTGLRYQVEMKNGKKKQSDIKGERSYYSSSKTQVYVYEITVTKLTTIN